MPVTEVLFYYLVIGCVAVEGVMCACERYVTVPVTVVLFYYLVIGRVTVEGGM